MSETYKAVLVLEVDFADDDSGDDVMTQMRNLLGRVRDHLSPGMKAYAAVQDDAEMVLDVFRPAESGGGLHVAVVQGTAWHLEHSLRCRRAGLERCPMTQLVRVAWEGDHFEHDGRWRTWQDETGVLLWEEA